MDAHAQALEAFNRATHDPATPEMQVAHAEELQTDRPLVGATVPFWIYPVAAFFAFTGVIVWAAS